MAEDSREYPSGDVSATDRPELPGALCIVVQAGGAELAPQASAEGVSPLPSDGAVEGGGRVIGVQPVEVQVHGQDVNRPRAIDAEELLVRGRLIEAVLVDDHELGPEGRHGPAPGSDDSCRAVERTTHVGEVTGTDEPLGTE